MTLEPVNLFENWIVQLQPCWVLANIALYKNEWIFIRIFIRFTKP